MFGANQGKMMYERMDSRFRGNDSDWLLRE